MKEAIEQATKLQRGATGKLSLQLELVSLRDCYNQIV